MRKNGIQSTSEISDYVQKPKRKIMNKSLRKLSSNIIVSIIGIIIFILIIFIYLIRVNYSYCNSLTSTNTVMTYILQEIQSELSLIDKQINNINEEFNQLDTEAKTLIEKKTKEEDEESNLQKQSKSATFRFFQSKNMLEETEDQLFTTEIAEKRARDDLKVSQDNQMNLLNKIKELENILKAKEDLIKLKKLYKGISSILSEDDFCLLNQWINPQTNNTIQYILKLRDKIDNLTPHAFHSQCGYSLNSLLVIKLADKQIIGGFTCNNWYSYSKLMKDDPNAFVFNMKNRIKYDVKNSTEAIITNANAFPQFGIKDIIIYEGVCYSKFPISYGRNAKPNELTNGLKEIKIEEIEVFNVIFTPRSD